MRGMPREQYQRTVVLLSPKCNSEYAKAVIDATWSRSRYTISGSADDAGIGDLDHRRVIAVNPADWPSDLKAFFEEHYPGVIYEEIFASSPDDLRAKLSPVLLWQCRPLWANVLIPGTSHTICQRGCFITCCAMAQRYLGINGVATPLTVLEAVGSTAFSAGNLKHSAMQEKLGLKVLESTTSKVKAEAHLKAGGICIAEVLPTTLQHFVLVTKPGWMLDPLRNFEGPITTYYSGIESWRLIERYAPAPVPPPAPSYPLRGVHDLAGGWWLKGQGLEGWCVEPVYLTGGTGQRIDALGPLSEAGIRVLLRLNYSFATSDGGEGTMPPVERLAKFEKVVLETMRMNPEAWGFLYCNEMNRPGEWPEGTVLTMGYYINSYNRIYSSKPQGARLIPGAIDPTTSGWGDWRVTWPEILTSLKGADALALHAYCHGPDLALIRGTRKFGDDPLKGVYYDLRMLESQQEVIPVGMRKLPQIVTETNHLTRVDGKVGWESAAAAPWLREAFKYFKERGVVGVCPFRFNHDTWNFGTIYDALEEMKKWQ